MHHGQKGEAKKRTLSKKTSIECKQRENL